MKNINNKMKERFKLLGAVYLFLEKDNKILMSKRVGSGFMDGYYGLVSGHIEDNETARAAMSREAKEEINLDIFEEDLELKLTLHRKSLDCEYIDLFFTVKKYSGKLNNNEPQKCSELNFFDINRLPENTIPYISKAIKSWKNNIIYLEDGWI